jgi:hypothetical protein
MNEEMKIIYTDDISEEDLECARETLRLYDNYDPTDEEVMDEALNARDEQLGEDAITLMIPTQNPIIAYGSLGLWDGRYMSLVVLGSVEEGASVEDIFHLIHQAQCPTEATIYADAEDVHFREAHHDGVNLYTFRELLGNEEDVEELLDELRTAVYDNNADKFNELIQTKTKSIRSYVAEVYGW